MYNLTNATNLTIFTEGANIDVFYSTIASVSTVFIITMCTFFIYMMSKINDNIHKKNDEIKNYGLEIHEYNRKNERMNKIINDLTQSNNIIKYEEKFRRCSESIINNNLYKEEINNKSEENEKLIEHNKNIKADVISSVKYIYLFLIIFVIVPLFFLSFLNSPQILFVSNVLKMPLLVIFCWFVLDIIKICKTILKYDTSD